MEQYSYNNHFKFGWGKEWFNSPDKSRKNFRISFGKTRSETGSFRVECERAALLIAESTTDPIVVALSGGIDSEVIARSFLSGGIPFKAAVLRFAHGVNKRDINYAITFCKLNKIEYFYVDVDVEQFWKGQLFTYTKSYGVTSTHRPLMMYLMDYVDGYVVIGGGDLRLKRDEGSDIIYFGQYHDSTALQRFLMDRSRGGCPRFFMFTPEIIHSFLKDPLIEGWMQCARAMGMLTIKNFKPLVFHRLWPEMQPRQKLHGFELLELTDMKLREELQVTSNYDPQKDEILIRPAEILAALSNETPTYFHAGRKIK